jgi:hypothetical protein
MEIKVDDDGFKKEMGRIGEQEISSNIISPVYASGVMTNSSLLNDLQIFAYIGDSSSLIL